MKYQLKAKAAARRVRGAKLGKFVGLQTGGINAGGAHTAHT